MIEHIIKKALHRPIFLTVLFFLILWIGLAAGAPWVATHDPYAMDMDHRLLSHGHGYLLGTDQLGRDLFSRIVYGGRETLSISLFIVCISASIGVLVGTVTAFAKGKLYSILSNLLDILLSFPSMIIALAIVGVLGAGVSNIMFAIIVTYWIKFARLTKNLVIAEKEKPYIKLSRFSGISFLKKLRVYIIPNVLPHILVVFCQEVGEVILMIAGFSLVGVGLQPPSTEWGTLLMGARNYMQTAPWLLLYPGLAIFITVILLNLFSDLMRDLLDPKNM